MYVELHAHSAYSFLDGASTPEELLAAAAVGVYLFFNSLSLATGGKALPLGSPLLK